MTSVTNPSRFCWLLTICALLTGARTGQAWGPEGHEIVGRIAEEHLDPAALMAVNELLTQTNGAVTAHIGDDEVANWADYVRKSRAESAPWHFVDIPFAAEKYDAERDCREHHGCVVSAIDQFQQVLADRRTNTEARVEALKFLVHFVGDIHQPLHCAERNGDKGGNLCWVLWPGDTKATKLHVIWDINLPRKNLQDQHLAPVPYADRLNRAITPAEAKSWAAGTPADWAWESHRLAVTQVYDSIPVDGPAEALSDSYVAHSQRLVDEQLSKAGIRLAMLLNETLR